jgi:hypothetical protein
VEKNIGAFVWNFSSEEDSVESSKRKSVGITPSMAEVLQLFDTKLETFLADFAHFFENSHKFQKLKEEMIATSKT